MRLREPRQDVNFRLASVLYAPQRDFWSGRHVLRAAQMDKMKAEVAGAWSTRLWRPGLANVGFVAAMTSFFEELFL
jgi:hypothetical protein